MKNYLVVLFLGLSTCLWGQKDTDVITLKSGAVYKGVISEYLPYDSVTIKLVDGRVMSFKADEVKRISEEGKRIMEIKKVGGFNRTAFAVAWSKSGQYLDGQFTFNTTVGYKYYRSNFGVTTGIEPVLDALFIPIMGDYTFNLSDTRFSTFANIQGGFMVNPAFENPNPLDYSGAESFKNGYTIGAQFGVRNYLNDQFAMVFSVGYRYYHLRVENAENPSNVYQYMDIPLTADLHRFTVKIGVLLN
tara:strand:+ start:37 stop:774 length:738 start_codon:yes stop_codon:yes gene_type:complete